MQFHLAIVLLAGSALASDVSPVEKVVTMLEDLQTQVVVEGKAEAKTYDKFACFCKDMTAEKTDAINAGTDKSADLSALIEQLTNDRSEADDDINDLNKKIDELDASMKENKEKRAAEKATFDALHAELTKGITDLTNAVNTLKGSRPSSLMSLKSVIKTIRQAAFMGDAIGHSPNHQKALSALLQQEPEVPMEDFTFHSEEIISTIEGLQSDFKTKLSEVKIEETKAVSDFDLQMQADTDERAAAAKELKDTTELKAQKMEAIAASSKELTETSATLTDDQNYLKDLTEKCNSKSKEWDQRSQMRQDELTALTTALTIVKEGVATKTTEKTVRLVQSAAKVAPHSVVTEDNDDEDDSMDEEDLSFVQLSSPRGKLALVQTAATKFLQPDSTRDRVIALLKSKSSQLDSPVLAALATKAAADPFVKIKKLIQELIERLLQEAADEANHKGWCDKEFGKAKQSRAMKAEAVKTLNENLAKSEALRDKLTEEIAVLTKEIDELQSALDKTTKERNDESAENAATVSEAQEGQAAVEQAIGVLEKFYKTAAKAEVFVQTSSKQVPDMPDAGFEGANKGSQSASTGILGMLDVIKSDFIRTIKETEKAEKAAAKEFMEFETTTKVSLGTKKVSKSAKEGELTEVNASIDEDNTSLGEEQSLLDKSIQEIVELQPACVDTGMSYEERVAKREQEIEALKEALCTLDKEGPEQTEAECA
jgi:DNA repair exonuclease SbcCD ATPase subunit